MPVTRLALTDFRSYTQALIVAGSGFVLLVGENGAGKTNVLEALSLLAPGRGLRRAPLAEMAMAGGPGGFTVSAALDCGDAREAVQLGTGVAPERAGRRIVQVNGAETSAV